MKNPRLTIAIVRTLCRSIGRWHRRGRHRRIGTESFSWCGFTRWSCDIDRARRLHHPNRLEPPDDSNRADGHGTSEEVVEVILVNDKGLPLYIYKPDTATTSMVTGELAALWPPLVASAPTGSGTSGVLAAVPTGSGRQVTYNGHFLYTFVEDSPGQVTGQGVGRTSSSPRPVWSRTVRPGRPAPP